MSYLGESAGSIQALLEKHLPRVQAMRDVDGVILERPRGRPRTTFTDEQLTDIINLYRDHCSLKDIALAFRTSPEIIRRTLVSARIRIRRHGSKWTRGSLLYRRRIEELSRLSRFFRASRLADVRVHGKRLADVLADASRLARDWLPVVDGARRRAMARRAT